MFFLFSFFDEINEKETPFPLSLSPLNNACIHVAQQTDALHYINCSCLQPCNSIKEPLKKEEKKKEMKMMSIKKKIFCVMFPILASLRLLLRH